ncbi:MAG: serine/threonine protein kinase [Mariniblastus sp.]
MAESAHKVLHELTAAGLLSSDHATKYGEEIETGAEALLTKLVKDGHITQFQADKFKDGKASDIYFGDYVVIDKLGQGGMGTVLLAKHRVMDRQVAIKILPVTILESKDAVARFFQEVKVAAQLTHPNIVHAYDAGEQSGFHYLVMEYVKGHDLAQVLSQLGMVPSTLALDYIMQAAGGLEYAHGKGIIHRDIKPSNLLLDDEGKVKILDMGLARIGGGIDSEASVHLTTTGQVMGTVEYMSPEQAEDTRQADVRSDIYSLGCTLFRLMTGRGPYSRETVVKTILAHRDSHIPIIETGSPDDPAINRLFQKMVAKDPNQRFQTMTMLIEAIRQIEEGAEPDYNLVPPIQPQGTGMRAAGVDTAVAVHFVDSTEAVSSIPEAIIPDAINAGMPDDPILPPESVVSVTSGYGQQSEVLYIPDIAPPVGFRRPIRRARNWIKANRSRGIFVWSIISMATCSIGLGLIFGWFTWRAANQDLDDIQNNRRDPSGLWMTQVGKYISILTTICAPFATIANIRGW